MDEESGSNDLYDETSKKYVTSFAVFVKLDIDARMSSRIGISLTIALTAAKVWTTVLIN